MGIVPQPTLRELDNNIVKETKLKSMEFIESNKLTTLSNPGVDSVQLISPLNSNSKRVTITDVKVQPGCSQPRHKHDDSEQIWIALEGSSKLLLAEDRTKIFNKGDIVRFEAGDIHGLQNDSENVFQYMAVTSPPINFDKAYKKTTSN